VTRLKDNNTAHHGSAQPEDALNHSKRITNRALLSYSSLAFPLAAAFIVMQILIPTHYAEATGLSMTTIGIVLLIARLFDMLSDPVVGWLSDRTALATGKRKTWIVAASPLLAFSIYKLFNPDLSVNASYLLTWSVAVYAFGTLMIVPMNAWGAEMTSDYNQRSRITGVRAGAGLVGTLCALMIPAVLNSTDETSLADSINAITWMVIVTLALAVLLATFLVSDRSRTTLPNHSIREMIGLLRLKTPLRQLISSFFFNGVGNAIPATLFLFYVSYVLKSPERTGQLLFLYFICAVLSIPLWINLCYRFEKHNVWIVAILVASLFFLWTPLLGEGDIAFFVVIVAITGVCAGADLFIPTSIKGDLIEWDMLTTGHRRPGIFFALWGKATKLAFAVAIGLAFPLLEWIGFDASADNTDSSLQALALIYGLPCIAFKLWAARLMWKYPITRDEHLRIRTQLESTHS